MTIEQVLKTIFQPYKGILAADARASSMDKRLKEHDIAVGAEIRARYRTLLFSTPNLERTISGIILAEDTFQNHSMNGVPTREYLAGLGIAVGVKVDGGLTPYNNSKTLQTTQGLEGLQERCARYREQGAVFLKWRSAIPAIGATDDFIETITADMATYAQYVLNNEMVPILEPEILLAGNHSADDTATVFVRVIPALIKALAAKECDPHRCILKTSFITNGLDGKGLSAEEVAKKTLMTFKEVRLDSPKSFYGIVFLSGGLLTEPAITYIQRIKTLAEQPDTAYIFDTPITFSYARALQEPAMTEWKGEDKNILTAQVAFTQTLQHAIKKYKGKEEAPLGSDGKEV